MVYLAGWLPIEGIPGFLVYYFTSFIVAGLLYICVERPFLTLRGRFVSIATSLAVAGRSIAVL
jgi:peptidoglycan/LPS O-acetylase OafA/YrhL